MNKMTTCLLIIIMALSISLAATRQSHAQSKSFVGILPFSTSNGRVGFLDQSNGRIYLYDSDISKCVFTGQIEGLGQPINVISNNPSTNL